MRLTCGSFQLTHMSRDDHAVQLIEPWRPKRRQNIITALTKLPQGWVLAQRRTAIMCGQNLCGHFVRVVLATNIEESDRAMAADRVTKALVSPPPR